MRMYSNWVIHPNFIKTYGIFWTWNFSGVSWMKGNISLKFENSKLFNTQSMLYDNNQAH